MDSKTGTNSVVIEYSDLVNNKNLHSLIEQAYGPQGSSIST